MRIVRCVFVGQKSFLYLVFPPKRSDGGEFLRDVEAFLMFFT